jgi:hypothetical protein
MRGTQLRLFILFFCVAGSLLILQSAFDSSDHKKAERAVRNYTVAGRVLGPFLEARAPGGVWTTEITQGCRGIVRTRYETPQAQYEFDYDVPGHLIHPANELGMKALEAFTITDGGAPHD